MRKLIDDYIVTVKEDDTYYTYCTLWDNPELEYIPFPNSRVGVGSTKKESLEQFMLYEKKRQEMLLMVEKTKDDYAKIFNKTMEEK